MRSHGDKAPGEDPFLAHQHFTYHRLQVVIDPFTTGAPEKVKGPDVSVQHYLQGLSHIGNTKRHTAVAETKLGDLDPDIDPTQFYLLITPVELESLAGSKRERNERLYVSVLG